MLFINFLLTMAVQTVMLCVNVNCGLNAKNALVPYLLSVLIFL